MLESAAALVQEHADLEKQLADPEVFGDQDLVRKLNKRYAALAPTVAAYHAWHAATDDLAAARELAKEDEGFAAEVPSLEATLARRRGEAAPAARAARPRRRPRHHPRGQGGRGRRRVGPVRRRPAADVPALRRAARLEDRAHRRDRVRPRRLQGRPGRRQGQGHAGAGRGPVGAAEVRGRGAPRAAGARHREPGPHPHLRGRRPRDARGRGGRGHHRPQRPQDRRLPLLRPRRPVGQHHRLGRADHPPADRYRRLLPEREVPAPEQGVGHARAARPAAPDRPGRGRRRGLGRPSLPVRTVDRSERIRTYNYPENRICDHRTGFKSYNLDAVLDGDLDPVVQSAVDADEKARMAAVAEGRQ